MFWWEVLKDIYDQNKKENGQLQSKFHNKDTSFEEMC
jgi:hypothetical protein